jgi:tetratricopeptide (TPR) repeat protein
LYAEYALFATALESPAATLADLVSTLEQQNPKSKYLDAAYGPYLVALSQTGASAKIPAIAEKALVNFPENADLLLLLADTSVNRKQPDRALTYANRLVAVLAKHPKPEGMAAAQWERKRNSSMGRGYWIAGVIYGERNQYVNADKNLRSALPLIEGNEAMMAAAYFYLGMANYQLGKMTLSKARILEAARFSQQSAAINSGFADQARHNALVMKAEADRMH